MMQPLNFLGVYYSKRADGMRRALKSGSGLYKGDRELYKIEFSKAENHAIDCFEKRKKLSERGHTDHNYAYDLGQSLVTLATIYKDMGHANSARHFYTKAHLTFNRTAGKHIPHFLLMSLLELEESHTLDIGLALARANEYREVLERDNNPKEHPFQSKLNDLNHRIILLEQKREDEEA